ncbi:MAG: RES domain-containing protein [Melioribacteraceae bacterium]
MNAYRLVHSRYADDLSGYGAYKVGGRWNPKGYYTLYLAEHPCGAILESFVHMSPHLIPNDYSLVTFSIKNSTLLKKISERSLPENWRTQNYDLSVFQNIGKVKLFDKNLLGIFIPSSVAYPSYNIVVNPSHKKFKNSIKIKSVEPYIFDFRLFKKIASTTG